jgi:Domain of unknown function DUF83
MPPVPSDRRRWRCRSDPERLGIVARIDLLEPDGDSVVPTGYKAGAPRDGPAVLWPPEQIQLRAQVLLLRDAGYRVDRAQVWFAATRTRHDVPIDDDLIDQTLQALAQLRATAARDEAPAPLVDSPKCPRCSLVGLCLPDELNLLAERAPSPRRRLVVSDPAAQPLYASTPGARLTKRGGRASCSSRTARRSRRGACSTSPTSLSSQRRRQQRASTRVLRRGSAGAVVHARRLVQRLRTGHAGQERGSADASASRGRDRRGEARQVVRQREDPQPAHAASPPRRRGRGARARATRRARPPGRNDRRAGLAARRRGHGGKNLLLPLCRACCTNPGSCSRR